MGEAIVPLSQGACRRKRLGQMLPITLGWLIDFA